MFCPNCGTSVDNLASFCSNCGTTFPSASGDPQTLDARNAAYPLQSRAALSYAATPEEKRRRVAAYLIDIIPMLFLALVHLLPIFGWMLYGLIHVCYWLLRDINGASPGKLVVGSYVANADGTASTTSQRIMRNVPLALPGIIGMIPLIGIFFEFGFAVIIFAGEAILLLATGRRLGDRLANTQVFRK
ncbi:MAG TPA: RDD family protein [Bryobacteraceae bacterium]|nr:RDD family protein [Bryobacteraceae bacterium]